MSALIKLAHRHGFLSRTEVAAAVQALTAAFAAAAVPFRAPGMLPEGVLQGVECDLIYALVRHRIWCNTPLFASVLIDYLAVTFQLPRPVALSFTQALLPAARLHCPKETLMAQTGDQEFLRYICVVTATAQDEPALLLDLGLGRHLLLRIREALQLLLSEHHDEDGVKTSRFLPELDTQITQVVLALGRELKAVPWVLQQERLRYLLAAIQEPWLGVLREHGVTWLFDLLLAIASRKAMNTRQIATHLRSLFPQEKGFILDASVGALCLELGRHHLLSLERGLSTWRALPLAEELTADAFALRALAEAPDLRELSGLNGPFQASMIRAMDLGVKELEPLLLHLRPLTPIGLRAALNRWAELVSTPRLEQMVATLLTNEPSAWLRKAVSDHAAALGIALELAPMARSAPWLSDLPHSKPVLSALD